jgi:UDP-N-acetylglucosamine 2-epimerase
VGNTSVDACQRVVGLFDLKKLKELNLEETNYIILTIHRQENTEYKKLMEILNAVNSISDKIKVVFPMHLRTRKIIENNEIEISKNILLIDPVGYKDFIGLIKNSKFVMTDSGGIQEEAAILNVPCLILRENTEWEYLVNIGKNILVGTSYNKILNTVTNLLNSNNQLNIMKEIKAPIKKDASKRIIDILNKIS